MSRTELYEKINATAKEVRAAGYKDAAVVLFSLCGAVASCDERELSGLCASFSTAQLEKLTGEVDWSQDTLKA